MTDSDLTYFDEEEEGVLPSISERAAQAAIPAGGVLVGALAGSILGMLTPNAAIALSLVGAFGGQLPKHPAFKALIMGATGGLLGAGITRSIAMNNGARQTGAKLSPKEAVNALQQGIKAQWPFNLSKAQQSDETPSDGAAGVGDPELEFQRLMLQLQEQNFIN